MTYNDPLKVVPGFLWKYSKIVRLSCAKVSLMVHVSHLTGRQEGRLSAVSCRFCVIGNKNFGAKLLLATVGAPRGLDCFPRAWFSLDGQLRAVIWFSGSLEDISFGAGVHGHEATKVSFS